MRSAFLFTLISVCTTLTFAQEYSDVKFHGYLNAGDTLRAIYYLEDIAHLENGSWKANYNLGLLYLDLELMDSSVYHFNSSLEKNPELFEPNYYLGHYYFKRDSARIAAEYYSKYLVGDEENKEIKHFRAQAYMKYGDYYSAISDWTELYKESGELGVLFNRGLAKMGMNDQIGAREDFQEVINQKSNFLEAYYYTGFSHLKSFDRKEAEKWWKKVLEMDPAHIKTNYQMGKMYFDKRQGKACKYIEKAIESGWVPLSDEERELAEACIK